MPAAVCSAQAGNRGTYMEFVLTVPAGSFGFGLFMGFIDNKEMCVCVCTL